jgi:hypothetical protein
MAEGLKLRAEDDEDVAVLSTVLQDALVAIGEMVYLLEERRFVLVANRFRWEPDAADAKRRFQRVFAGLRVDGVTGVQRRGFDPRDGERLLSLLALRAGGSSLFLDFAGGASVRLDVERILCHLEDLGEPWPTKWRPRHPLDEAG